MHGSTKLKQEIITRILGFNDRKTVLHMLVSNELHKWRILTAQKATLCWIFLLDTLLDSDGQFWVFWDLTINLETPIFCWTLCWTLTIWTLLGSDSQFGNTVFFGGLFVGHFVGLWQTIWTLLGSDNQFGNADFLLDICWTLCWTLTDNLDFVGIWQSIWKHGFYWEALRNISETQHFVGSWQTIWKHRHFVWLW